MEMAELMENQEKIWFYVDEDVRKDFTDEMEKLGVKFSDTAFSRSKASIGPVEVLHKDLSLRHLPLFIAVEGFDSFPNIKKINWKKFREGKDYLVRKNPYQVIHSFLNDVPREAFL